MDLDVIAKVLERAIASLKLDAPLHPQCLGEARPPRRPVRLNRALASPCPSISEFNEDRLLEAFLPEDRGVVARQIDAGYQHLVSLFDGPLETVDEASVLHVQLGLPLIGRDRALLRVLTRNSYGKEASDCLTADHHAWPRPHGSASEGPEPGPAGSRIELHLEEPLWGVDRNQRVDAVGRRSLPRFEVNTATESEPASRARNAPGASSERRQPRDAL